MDKDPGAARVIEKNRVTLGAQGQVAVMDVARFLTRKAQACDVVWLDPPYDLPSTTLDQVVRLIDQGGWVKSGGFLLVERSVWTSAVEFPETFLSAGQRRYGGTTMFHAQRGVE